MDSSAGRTAIHVLRLVLARSNVQLPRFYSTAGLTPSLIHDAGPSTLRRALSALDLSSPTSSSVPLSTPTDFSVYLEPPSSEYTDTASTLPRRTRRPISVYWPTLLAPRSTRTDPIHAHVLAAQYTDARALGDRVLAEGRHIVPRKEYLEAALACLKSNSFDDFLFFFRIVPNHQPAWRSRPIFAELRAVNDALWTGDVKRVVQVWDIAADKGLLPTVYNKLMSRVVRGLSDEKSYDVVKRVIRRYVEVAEPKGSTSVRAQTIRRLLRFQRRGMWFWYIRRMAAQKGNVEFARRVYDEVERDGVVWAWEFESIVTGKGGLAEGRIEQDAESLWREDDQEVHLQEGLEMDEQERLFSPA